MESSGGYINFFLFTLIQVLRKNFKQRIIEIAKTH